MFGSLIYLASCAGCLFLGAAFPVGINRLRRKILSGKMFGKLPEDAKDPTRA